jgi:hypothetical protein
VRETCMSGGLTRTGAYVVVVIVVVAGWGSILREVGVGVGGLLLLALVVAPITVALDVSVAAPPEGKVSQHLGLAEGDMSTPLIMG